MNVSAQDITEAPRVGPWAYKRILYFSPDPARFQCFLADLAQVAAVRSDAELIEQRLRLGDLEIEFVGVADSRDAVACLQEHYVHLLVVDLRYHGDDVSGFHAHRDAGLTLIHVLDDADDLEARYGFHRIVGLVSGPDQDRVDDLIAALGATGVGRVLRERPSRKKGLAAQDLVSRLLDVTGELIVRRTAQARALCCSGGGITGIFFELGTLKCLDDCLPGDALNTFDMYFGISAGAVVTGLLSAGYSIDEFMAAIAGVEGGRIAPLDLALLKLEHLNYPDLRDRLKAGLGAAARAWWDTVRLRSKPDLQSVIFEYGDIVGPPFRSDRFEGVLRDLLSVPGSSNDFRDLPHQLFIGASDQDTRRHVLFGDEDHSQVPISRAIQASMSVNPAFTSVGIEGRYYEDGAVTRTSNFVSAIERGADLLFIVDPFVPYVSRSPGFARGRGVLYNVDQDIRTVSYTRFENTRNWVLRKHPEVSSYTFLPSNRLRRLLSVNPMDHRPYLRIWRGAYLSTLNRLRRLSHRLRGDLGVHQLGLDLSRAEAVARRLESVDTPDFSDFFADGVVRLKRPPLCMVRSGRRSAA